MPNINRVLGTTQFHCEIFYDSDISEEQEKLITENLTDIFEVDDSDVLIVIAPEERRSVKMHVTLDSVPDNDRMRKVFDCLSKQCNGMLLNAKMIAKEYAFDEYGCCVALWQSGNGYIHEWALTEETLDILCHIPTVAQPLVTESILQRVKDGWSQYKYTFDTVSYPANPCYLGD